jgi:hypothetical protein
MDAKIIVIVVLVIIVIALGVVSFVPFGGKLLMCSNVSNIVSASNCSIAGYISKSDCPVTAGEADEESCKSFVDAKECPASSTTPATATSCKSFVDAEAAKYKPEAFYTDLWCDTKYATLSTTPKFCTASITAYDAYVASLATKFNSIRLIKASQGNTVKFFYDPASTAAAPSPTTLTVAAIEATTYQAKVADAAAVLNAIITTEYNINGFDYRLREFVLSHVLVALGVIKNDDYVQWKSNRWQLIKITTPSTYSVIPGLWTTIGSGNSWTYSYLDLTSNNRKALLAELKKPVDSAYAIFCL